MNTKKNTEKIVVKDLVYTLAKRCEPPKIAIKCDQLNIDTYREFVICTTRAVWMPVSRIEIPLSAVRAIWRNHGVVVVDVVRNKTYLMALRTETLPDDEPDAVSYKITVCEKGHRVDLVEDDYYCPVCRRDSDAGLRVKKIEVKIPSSADDWRDAELGPPVIDDALCCTENNIAYFFERFVGAKPDGIDNVNIIHIDKEEKYKNNIIIRYGLGFESYDDQQVRDLAYYAVMYVYSMTHTVAPAWKKLRDATLDDMISAVRNNTRATLALVHFVDEEKKKILCAEAWKHVKSASTATDICSVCGPPPDGAIRRRIAGDTRDLKHLMSCLENYNVDVAELREEEERRDEMKRREEEERRKKLEKKRKKEEMRKMAKIEEIRMQFAGMPVIVEEKDGVIYVKLEKRADDLTFRQYVQTCKKLGMRFDGEKKAWYLKIESREHVDILKRASQGVT